MSVKQINSDFENNVHQFVVKTGVRIDLFTKKVAFQVYNSVTLRTPVDTGRARASWTFVRGNAADISVAPEDSFKKSSAAGELSGSAASSAADTFAASRIRLNGIIPIYTVANNLEYIEFLEDGTSKQAPNGMVKTALADVIANLENLIVKARNNV